MFHIRHVGHDFRGIDLYFANSLRQPEFMCHLTNIKILTDNHSAKIDLSLPVAVCMKHKSLKHPLGFAEAQQSITTWWFLTLWSWIWGRFCISYLQSRNAMFLANSNQTSKWRLAKPFPSKWLAVKLKCTNWRAQAKENARSEIRFDDEVWGAVLWYNIHVGGGRA